MDIKNVLTKSPYAPCSFPYVVVNISLAYFFFCHVIFIFKYRNSRVSRISEFHQIIYRNGSKINFKKLFCKLYCYTFNTFSLSGSTTVYRQLIRRKDEKIVNEKVKTEKNHAIKWIMSAILVKILPFLEHKKTVY